MSNGRVRSTLSKTTVDETGFHDLEDQHQRIRFRIGCGGDSPALELDFGPGVPDGPATKIPIVGASSGQVQLEFPVFMARAWRLVDCDIEIFLTVRRDGFLDVNDRISDLSLLERITAVQKATEVQVAEPSRDGSRPPRLS